MARTSRVQPTHYPRITFHSLRSAQLLAAAVVTCVLAFFVDQLHRDGYSIPWTFLLLLTVSVLTLLFLCLTLVQHCCCGLNPRLNLLLNSGLLVIWTLGFALLSWWSSGTMGHVCNKANWHDDDGIMICRIYKALFSFSLLGLVSTLAALLLDIYVFKRSTRRGKYNQMLTLDVKRGASAPQQSPWSTNVEEPYAEQRPFEDQQDKRVRKTAKHTGYAVPDEQFAYDDTGYYGAHDSGVGRGNHGAML
ncbi:marvel domain-containing protein 2 [Diplodia corticola]|uniref:Marvel domain-containing protein 2 n=1 Tax=Diplodia corticola TaxID=236234 RepID=A0A1J9RVL6_9PEZI|nr:marvel domain-containing protein 2 [Diplodia corticola]OJD36651.1 marvel domain-containing protein 2 [Diplodia corticola]